MTNQELPSGVPPLYSGVIAINLKTYQILYADGGMKRLYPLMRPGAICYEACGYELPCPGCPVALLEHKPVAEGIQHGPGTCNQHKVIAARLEAETGMHALVFREAESARDKQDREQLERQISYLLRLACDSITEVDLETGRYMRCACGESDAPPQSERGEYERLLDRLEAQADATGEKADRLRDTLGLQEMRQRLEFPERGLEYTVQVLRRQGENQSRLELRVFLMRDQGRPLAMILATDITGRTCVSQEGRAARAAEETRWMNDERSRLAFQQMQAVVFEYLPESEEYFVSPRIASTLAGEYDGRPLPEIFLQDGVVFPDDRYSFERFYQDALQYGGSNSITLRLKSRDALFRWHRISFSTLSGSRDRITRMIGTICDVDEETRLRESLRYRAEYDLVTGIYNKTTFYQRTEQILWNEPGFQHSIIRFDIDRFKMVNDLFGVSEGDTLLHFIGKCIQVRMRPGETYARLGDDVFGMCVSRTDEEIAQLIQELDDELTMYPLGFKLVPSAGVYRVARFAGEPINVLCDRAGLAQKTVKGSYARRYAFYEPQLGQKLFLEQEIISDMHQAISEQQFVIYLQPKYDIRNNMIFGAEALVRWQHPEKGLISPADFIPLFEKNGFIITLDEYVWEAVCQMLSRWIRLGYRPVPISVNVSRMHLFDPQFCDKITQLLAKYRLPPHLVELELTESAYVENAYFLGEAMEKLQDQGFTFLMDDFGSGYSSLNMLRTISVDVLKIDLGFLQECQAGSAGRIILESTLEMAQRLRLPVIAEGVETAEQAAFLLSAGCTLAQGYYYSKPLPVAEFERGYYENTKLNPRLCTGET